MPDARLHAPQHDPLVDALVRSGFAVASVLTRVGAEHDLSLTQMRLLGVLRDRRLRMSTLAAHLGLERSTVSGLVDRAERRDLVRRSSGPGDGRSVEVSVSRAGARLVDRAYEVIAHELSTRTGRLGRAERQRLCALLEATFDPEPFDET